MTFEGNGTTAVWILELLFLTGGLGMLLIPPVSWSSSNERVPKRVSEHWR